ncbi:hypothetical protein M2275_005175 [Rhodococcus opacus]|nr:hypothetical protein [Rhodococcus opacus]
MCFCISVALRLYDPIRRRVLCRSLIVVGDWGRMGRSDKALRAIPGWFYPSDIALFRFALTESGVQVGRGDLAEVGTYLGKSAVLIGEYVHPGEVFTVIDLFGDVSGALANDTENAQQYPALTEQRFRENYKKAHDHLPVIVKGPSEILPDHAAADAHRFIHIDGSHLYEHVATDVMTAQKLLAPQGIAVFDDYRSVHTPGVAAAVWQAVEHGMHVIAVSPMKMYATWGDPRPWRKSLTSWLPGSGLDYEEQSVLGEALFRVSPKPGVLLRALVAYQKRRK